MAMVTACSQQAMLMLRRHQGTPPLKLGSAQFTPACQAMSKQLTCAVRAAGRGRPPVQGPMPAAMEQEQHALRLALGDHQHLCALHFLHPVLVQGVQP